MTNPWLNIPASDYEGHMRAPNVAQTSLLAEIFKESLSNYNCNSIALLGCTTGNGLEYIDNSITKNLTVIDINPEYLKILVKRYGKQIPNLNVVEANLEEYENGNQIYSLIFAGLIFEYLNPRILLTKITKWLKTGGVMVSILQLPEQNIKKVSKTPYTSLKKLNSIMRLISAHEFLDIVNESGLREIKGKRITLKTGKSFYVGTYEKIA